MNHGFSRSARLGIGLFLLSSFAAAQDTLKLIDGTLVRGDVLSVVAGTVEMVTLDCTLRKFPGDQVAKLRRGKPMDPVILDRLKAIDVTKAEPLFALARWALKSKKLKKDGLRLLRRLVAVHPDHARAREILGHVKAGDTWYPGARAAFQALKEEMVADGYVYYRKGWIKKELLPFLQRARKDWVLHQGFLWRSLSEVRKERGDRMWDQQWYTHEEAKLVRVLSRLKECTEEHAHGARAGYCRVITVNGREEAQELAERQQQTRDWFVNTFDVKMRDKHLIRLPVSLDYVLSGEPGFERFLEAFKKSFGFSDRYAELCKQTQSATWSGLGHCVHLGTPAWKYSLVSALGHGLMSRFYYGRNAPAWIPIACAHHAEIAIFGDARVQWVGIGEYDQDIPVPKLEGRNLKQIKSAVRAFYSDRPVPGLRVLCSKNMNELSPELDLLGICYMTYFLEGERRGAWLDLLSRPGPNHPHKRFEKYFKKTLEAISQDFRDWLDH